MLIVTMLGFTGIFTLVVSNSCAFAIMIQLMLLKGPLLSVIHFG